MKYINDIITQFKSITLNIWDKIFLVSYTSLIIGMFYFQGMTPLTFGGVMLIYSAFLTYKGQILLSVATYIISDFCWVYNAWQQNDQQGVLFICMGIFFGVLATFKMSTGRMEKDLITKNKDK